MKRAGSGTGSGTVSQRFGSADPDAHPDPYQNVTDPEPWQDTKSLGGLYSDE
jgi:hypothetical protein